MLRKTILFLLSVLVCALQASGMEIVKVLPTAFFKSSDKKGQLEQLAWIQFKDAREGSFRCEIKVDNRLYSAHDMTLSSETDEYDLYIPDLKKPSNVSISIIDNSTKDTVSSWSGSWVPQKKWTIHCVTYSHHDLGYGNIPHILRRENRMENMELMLRYCRETDDWPEDSKYRAVLETSEPVTSYLSFCNKEHAAELQRRIDEGRIQVGGLHTTVNTEMLGHEVMARLFYLSNRHLVDMLGARPSTSANFDDVIGMTLPFFTFAGNAGIKNLFHGYNNCCPMNFMVPAQNEPVFYMQGEGAAEDEKVMVRAYHYTGDAIRSWSYSKPLGEDVIQSIVEKYEAQDWPFDALLSQDGSDFALLKLDNALHIKKLNEKYVYPRMICSTMDMFFSDIREQIDEYDVKTYQKDGNNQWADQPASDAKLIGELRKLDEAVPTAEKFAAVAAVLGNAYPWTDIYQAYHNVLLAHEHTCGSSVLKPAYQYATEQYELREMVADAGKFKDKALDNSIGYISANIEAENNTLVVFNPMNFTVSQCVSVDYPGDFRLMDNVSGADVPVQKVGDRYIFQADSIPSFGYKTYKILRDNAAGNVPESKEYSFENRFYKVRFDAVTGAIVSLFDKELDKELVDRNSPYKLNEYLFERYEYPGKDLVSQFYGADLMDYSLQSGPVADVVYLRQSGEGCRSIEQKIIFYKTKKQIDFNLQIDKSASGRTQVMNDTGVLTNKEAIYLALPFDVPDYRFRHSLPGMSIEPVVQQFDSVSTASYALRHFTSVYNDEYGIAVSPVEASLVQYGHPRSDAMPGYWGTENQFEKNPVYPENSSIFLYLLNNMFDVNINLSQAGKKSFSYSLTSYPVSKEPVSEIFGWATHNKPVTRIIESDQKGVLPYDKFSFVSSDSDNIICTTLKPSEDNADGYIMRFVEISGNNSTATVRLPMFDKIDRVELTDLVENGLNKTLKVKDGNSFEIGIDGFGVKTVRISFKTDRLERPDFRVFPVSDMRNRIVINNYDEDLVYKIYRSTSPDFAPGMLTYVSETSDKEYEDVPTLNYGNWINNVLLPDTQYYYKVVAFNRYNNRSSSSDAETVRTYPADEMNDIPNNVCGLKAVLVSDVSVDNYVNLVWKTNCEPDVERYMVYRSDSPDFIASDALYIGDVDMTQKGNMYYPLKEYDHQMFIDKTTEPNRIYYYQVYAVDAAGQMSKASETVSVRMKP